MTDQRSDYTKERALQNLDQIIRRVEHMRSLLDRSQFDLAALLDRLDYNSEEIVEFVRHEIAFDAYPGLLRGATGTLMSRAGNALDQSVLLANLLKDAGYEARILRGRLSDGDATALLAKLFESRPPLPPPGDMAAIEAVWATIAAAGPDQVSGELFDLLNSSVTSYGNVNSQADWAKGRLGATLSSDGIELKDSEITAELLEEVKDYFWVEFRADRNDGWVSLHPAFDPAQGTPDAVAYFADQVPDDLVHKVGISVEAERQVLAETKLEPLMSKWERPAANLIGRQITYMNVPNALSSDDFDVRSVADRTSYFLPTLNGELPEGAVAFDLDGVTAPPDVAANPAAAVFRTVGSKTESAVRALSQAGTTAQNQDDVRFLKEIWLTYTITAPGGDAQSIRRSLYRKDPNVSSNSADEVQQRLLDVWSVSGSQTFMVAVGDFPAAYILDRKFETFVGLRPALENLIAANFGERLDPEVLGSNKELEFAHELTFYGLAQQNPDSGDIAIYNKAPSIAGTWRRLVGRADLPVFESVFDIVTQNKQALKRTGNAVHTAKNKLMEAGIRATAIENLVRLNERSDSERINSIYSLVHQTNRDIPLRTLSVSDVRVLDSMTLPTVMKRSIRDSLERGYTAIVPERVTSADESGWWQVDTTTGETLGLGMESRGVSITERIITDIVGNTLYSAIVVGGMFFIICGMITSCSVEECGALALLGSFLGILIGLVMIVVTLAVASIGATAATIHTVLVALEAIGGAIEVGLWARKINDCGGNPAEKRPNPFEPPPAPPPEPDMDMGNPN